MGSVMRFLQWFAWVFSHDFMAINLFVSGFLIIAGFKAWQERDFSYAIIPFSLAAAATVFSVYKQTSQPKNTPCLGVDRVLCMDTERKGYQNIVSGEVILKETEFGEIYFVKLSTYSSVGGYSWLTAIIESVRTVKVRAGGFHESWDELCVPNACRTPNGWITFRRKSQNVAASTAKG